MVAKMIRAAILLVLTAALVFSLACASPKEDPGTNEGQAAASALPDEQGAENVEEQTALIELSKGNEAVEAEGFSSAEVIFEGGNYYLPENERIPLGGVLLLPVGWRVEKGLFEGQAYYPTPGIASLSLAGRLGDQRAYTVYDENGSCVGTMGYCALIWTDEMKEEYGYDSMNSDELLDAGMMICFSELSGTASTIALDGENAVRVTGGAGKTIVTRSGYNDTYEPAETRTNASFPLAATFDPEFNIGFFIEFAEDAVSEETLEQIASSMRIGRLA